MRLSNARHHSSTNYHKHAYKLYVKDMNARGECVEHLHNVFEPDPQQQTLGDSFCSMTKVQELQQIKKIEIAYFIAKKELPFSVYEDLIKLETYHGVDIGDQAYTNHKQCAEFVDIHGQFIASKLHDDLSKAKFYSVLTDGSTDKSVTEKEVVYVLYFDPYSKNDEIEVKLSFLYLKDVKKGDAPGILGAIEESFHSMGIMPSELYSKLIGFGADGASVNSGNKSGVKALLEQKAPWLIYTWCVAHKLELALKDALNTTVFQKVDNMLLRLYYLYHKSPKKLQELKTLHNLVKDTFEFEEGSLKPKRACGTRWISFKLSALRMVLDKYGVYMQHLQHLAGDKKCKDHKKICGYLCEWNSSRMLLYVAFFIDVLNPAAILSKAFQEDVIDSVGVLHNIKCSEESLDQLLTRSFEDLPAVKFLFGKLQKTDSVYTYQGIEFTKTSFLKATEDVKSAKNTIINAVHCAMDSRLKGASSIQLNNVATILNTEHWKSNVDVAGVDFTDVNVTELIENFQPVLLKQGFSPDASPQNILEEWHDMVRYTLDFLQPHKSCYKKTWKILFNCSKSTKWKNILTFIELLFSVPVCNAKLERMFSRLKRTKSHSRCSLGEDRLTNILRIVEEGPPLGSFDVSPVVHLWNQVKRRRPNQKKRQMYKKRPPKVKYQKLETERKEISGSDSESGDTSESFSDNENVFCLSDSSDSSTFEGFLPTDI
ncbi:zinc finger protein 862-like [Gigantopelta aegis]|uniref:zinc finger protein 862-like n=1 Tax=Gigantopelta aegis TaxID=1735272 RepID=UPI001B88C3D5|nr:zinc finger protein 862-like [Gigantopelta aegis]